MEDDEVIIDLEEENEEDLFKENEFPNQRKRKCSRANRIWNPVTRFTGPGGEEKCREALKELGEPYGWTNGQKTVAVDGSSRAQS